jgi:imidazolonepropionase-like amidohydrolase
MVTVLSHATVFDGTRFLPGTRDVVIDDGRVAMVAEGGQGSHNAGDDFIDCTGKTIIPGIIDCHVHLTMPGCCGDVELPRPVLAAVLQLGRAHGGHAQGRSDHGPRDAGGTDLGAKVAIETGLVRGPRLTIAVNILSQTGGHGDFHLVSGIESPSLAEHPGRPSGVADGLDEVQKKTREMLRAGADHIKICSTGGVLSPRDDPRHSQFTEPEIAVIVAEAAAQGAHVMSHAQGAPGIKNAVRAGVRSIEHGIYLDDEAIDLMLENGTYLVPTLQAPQAVIKAAEAGASLPPAVVDKAHRVVEAHLESTSRAYAAGVPIAMGTDAGVGPHGENLEEISLLAEVGLSTEAALAAGTSVAARVLDDDTVGSLAAGELADLVVIDGDLRTADIRGIENRVDSVYLGGDLV